MRPRCCSRSDKEYNKEGKLQKKIQESFWYLYEIKAIFTVKIAKEPILKPSKVQDLPGASSCENL